MEHLLAQLHVDWRMFLWATLGAYTPELIRLYKLRTGRLEVESWWFYLTVNLMFPPLAGLAAAGLFLPANELGAFYSGATIPVLFSTICVNLLEQGEHYQPSSTPTLSKVPLEIRELEIRELALDKSTHKRLQQGQRQRGDQLERLRQLQEEIRRIEQDSSLTNAMKHRQIAALQESIRAFISGVGASGEAVGESRVNDVEKLQEQVLQRQQEQLERRRGQEDEARRKQEELRRKLSRGKTIRHVAPGQKAPKTVPSKRRRLRLGEYLGLLVKTPN